MPIKKANPTTPSNRQTAFLYNPEIKKTKVKKSLLTRINPTSGRNNLGRITSRRRFSGAKKLYRIVDFKRQKIEIPAIVSAIVYDPNRSCNLAYLTYEDGIKSLILAPNGLTVGDRILSSNEADIKVGNSKELRYIPIGTLVHNIELHPGAGGQLARSAGSYAQLMAKEGRDVLLRMPSGELRKVKENCRATIGQVGNLEHENISLGKAGRSFHLGRRPKVRGVAMNPVDHPHGGGEGRTSGGRHPCTPWGKGTKGLKTRKNKRTNQFIVKRRK